MLLLAIGLVVGLVIGALAGVVATDRVDRILAVLVGYPTSRLMPLALLYRLAARPSSTDVDVTIDGQTWRLQSARDLGEWVFLTREGGHRWSPMLLMPVALCTVLTRVVGRSSVCRPLGYSGEAADYGWPMQALTVAPGLRLARRMVERTVDGVRYVRVDDPT